MQINRKRLLKLLLIATALIFPALAGAAEPMTVEKLFDTMEKRSEKIDAMLSRVELSNQHASKTVTLSVKNPDKFAIEFDDGSIVAFFNGQNLWIYVQTINEVFYHFSESQGFLSSYLGWFSPRKIFTSLTRKTLFSLFDITLIGSEIGADSTLSYRLKFVPKMKSVFKTMFDVGHYHMVFSTSNYLPTEVVEFKPGGGERGRLRVIEYRLNELLPDSYFDYQPPESATMVPITVIIAQKLEDSAAQLVDRLKNAAGRLKDSLWNWSF